jgi:serine/threonine protein kinase
VLYQALTGERPFAVEGMAQSMHAHLTSAAPRPSVGRAEVPAALDAVVERAMAKNPEERFNTAGELATAARAALAGAVAPVNRVAPPQDTPLSRGAGAMPPRRPSGQYPPQPQPPGQPGQEPAAPAPLDRNAPTVRPPRPLTAGDLPTVRRSNPPATGAGPAPGESSRFTGPGRAGSGARAWRSWWLPVAVVITMLLVLAAYLIR